MTPGALQALGGTVHRIAIDGSGNVLMAATTRVLRDLVIELRNLDHVGKPSGGEVKGMPETVVRLYRILPEKIVRSVAVVAGGSVTMTLLHPSIELCLHHVAVCTSGRIVREIGVSLGVKKCVSPEPQQHSG